MNKTQQFLSSLSKLNKVFTTSKDQKELERNIEELKIDNHLITSIFSFSENKPTSLAVKMIAMLNEHWVDILQEVDNIRELIDDKLSNS